MSTEQKTNPNEAREVSILKRNLRLLKRIVLGKQKPPMFLKILCFFFIGWDLLMTIFFAFIPIVGSMFGDIFEGTSLSSQDFYVYVLLHLISLVGVILMYRRFLVGFYMFSASNLAMAIWFFINGDAMNGEDPSSISWWTILAFALISILLFLLNWNKFRANIRKKEKKAELEHRQNG
ncbi:hypothetical protein [Parvicella tangerina]|uniref:Uncharacterized protein n=1 Tax=Parvicella tangerina TaxID=2829795 RepID=A0A916JP68_9FLAO|nr:hypothetical protein [Parvicella tangerina]CAG5083612.1 hypothetical protein CRYO30217_02244 [Parvicella tangerina]